MDFPISLVSSSKLPLRQQLGSELRRAIRSRRVTSGDTLPSSRHLAELLGISRDTVVRAYQDLLASGYLETRTGARTVVRKNASTLDAELTVEGPAPTNVEGSSSPPLSRYAQRLANMTLVNAAPIEPSRSDFGAAPADLLPTKQWRTILSRHCPPKEQTDDREVFGHRRLREAIASYLKRSKAINCHPDQILVFSDPQLALDLIARILIDPGDVVAIENPGRSETRETLLSHGARLQPVSIDSQGLITQELEGMTETCKLVYVTPSHHYPTGTVMSPQRRGELLQWARKRNAYVIEDGCDSDYRYGGQPTPAIQGLDNGGSVIYIYSFWKSLFPLATTGCLVLPPQLVDSFTRAKLLLLRNHPTVDNHVLTDFIAEGHLERHIWRTRSIYERRRRALIIALYKKFGEAVTVSKSSGGLQLMVSFYLGIPDDRLITLAGQAGLPLASTAAYYVGSPPTGEFLIPFAVMAEDEIITAVDRLAKLV